MALRTIRMLGDEILTKKCREVKDMTPRMRQLIDDMLETMYEANGVGLAAPQAGVLRRIVVIDIGEGPLIMVNPVLLETDGEQTGDEGCLSLPGKAGQVTRPNYVKARFFDEEMEEYEIEAEELLARAICHELDHLDGHMYVEKVEGEIHDVVYEEAEEDESDEAEEDAAAESKDDVEE
ncbi:MAG: peptide deformylase [Lachnospiraceae bacterium]|nr:peptide deformylase [Lachnospiraceae bacterium]